MALVEKLHALSFGGDESGAHSVSDPGGMNARVLWACPSGCYRHTTEKKAR